MVVFINGKLAKKGTYVLSSGGIIGDDKLVIVTTGDTLGTAIMTTNTATGVYEQELTQDYSNLYYAIRIASGTVCNNITFKPMLCEKSVYEAINGEFQPYALSNAELTNNVSLLCGKTVFKEQYSTSKTVTYTMKIADFSNVAACGVYMIYIVNWSTTPSISIYTAYYSGGVTTYSAVTKIAGTDAAVSVSGDTISVTSSGKIQIIAMQ